MRIEHAEPSITIQSEDAPTDTKEDVDPFYKQTLVLMSLVLTLASLGMELSAGLALREARMSERQIRRKPG